MPAFNTVIFCGGQGARNIILSLLKQNRLEKDIQFNIHTIVNAYDYSPSVAKLREIFHMPGASDLRKNLASLLDPEHEAYYFILKFLKYKTDRIAPRQVDKIIETISEGKTGTEKIFHIISKLPSNFRIRLKEGLNTYIKTLREKNTRINYEDFNLADAVFAGLYRKLGGLQEATDYLSESLPLLGRVYLNSNENHFLYGLLENKTSETPSLLLNESEIVAKKSSVRINRIFFLKKPLTDEEIQRFSNSSFELLDKELRERSVLPRPRRSLLQVLETADLLFYSPGVQHSSLLPSYLTEGIGKAIEKNKKARKIFFTNIGEEQDTSNYSAAEIFDKAYLALSRDFEKKPSIYNLFTTIVINKPAGKDSKNKPYVQPNLSYFERYKNVHINLVQDKMQGLEVNRSKVNVIYMDLEDKKPLKRNKHSIEKLTELLFWILEKQPSLQKRINSALTSGAILFDVDETILDVRIDRDTRDKYEETLLESPMLRILIELLERGFKICAVTGNDLSKFHKRFTTFLIDHLKKEDKLRFIENFEVYGNGAANHIFFNSRGEMFDDFEYNRKNALQEMEIHRIQRIISAATELFYKAEINHSPEDFAYRYDVNIWKYEYDMEARRWYFEEKPGERKYIPWVEIRSNCSMITIKPLPSKKHLLYKKDVDLRKMIFDFLKMQFKKEFGIDYPYHIKEGGWSSIDITRKGINKASAVKQYLDKKNLDPREVIYFGNEFRVGGNDQSILDEIKELTVISVNQAEEEIFFTPNIIYGGGRGVYSAMHHLSEILEIYKSSESQSYYDIDTVYPVIQQKISLLYKNKIKHRWKALQGSRNYNISDGIEIQKELVRSLNKNLRYIRKNTTLILYTLEPTEKKSIFEKKNGMNLLIDILDTYASICSDILLIVESAFRTELERLLENRCKNVMLIEASGNLGEGKAIYDVLHNIRNDNADVFICLSGSFILSEKIIRKTLDKHYESDSALTFPTSYKVRIGASVILRDSQNRVCNADYKSIKSEAEESERDCNIFVIKYRELLESLSSIHHTYYNEELSSYTFKQDKKELFRFLYIIEELYKSYKKVIALPIVQKRGFHENIIDS